MKNRLYTVSYIPISGATVAKKIVAVSIEAAIQHVSTLGRVTNASELFAEVEIVFG